MCCYLAFPAGFLAQCLLRLSLRRRLYVHTGGDVRGRMSAEGSGAAEGGGGNVVTVTTHLRVEHLLRRAFAFALLPHRDYTLAHSAVRCGELHLPNLMNGGGLRIESQANE
jgi:hypothetical protein